MIGFAEGQTCHLDDVTITPESRYGAIYITARGPHEDLQHAKQILARNTGMHVVGDERIFSKGESPILMEPVKATIHVDRLGPFRIYLLDHSGRRTAQTLPIRNGTFQIDGTRDKTCYYLLE